KSSAFDVRRSMCDIDRRTSNIALTNPSTQGYRWGALLERAELTRQCLVPRAKGPTEMKHLTQAFVNFLQREDGPTAVEYAVMLALIIVVCITAITALVGTMVGCALLIPMYAIGGMGAGDVKMTMGFGSWIGAFYGLPDAIYIIFWAFCIGSMAGGVIALGMIAVRGKYRQNIDNVR